MIATISLDAEYSRRAERGASLVGSVDDADEPNRSIDIASVIAALVASRRRPTPDALRPVREYAVARALRRRVDVPAQREISGLRRGRRPIRAGDPIDVRFAKYLQHVVTEEPGPPGTTFGEYLESLVSVVDSDTSGVFADRRQEGWTVTFVGRSGSWEGLDGGPFIVVLYDCSQDRLLTAFQPHRGIRYVDDNEQVVDGTWLRRPR